MTGQNYEDMLRERITQLRIEKNVSEHKMSLDLDKSGSYIRKITSGTAMPSVRELFNIIEYFNLTPAEFFMPMTSGDDRYIRICKKLQSMGPADLDKLESFLDWILK